MRKYIRRNYAYWLLQQMQIPTTTLGQMVAECRIYLDNLPNFNETYCRIGDPRVRLPASVAYKVWETLFTIANKFYDIPGRLTCMKIYTAYTEVLSDFLLEGNEVELGYLGRICIFEGDNVLKDIRVFKNSRKNQMNSYIYAVFAPALNDIVGKFNRCITKCSSSVKKLHLVSYMKNTSEEAQYYNHEAAKILKQFRIYRK